MTEEKIAQFRKALTQVAEEAKKKGVDLTEIVSLYETSFPPPWKLNKAADYPELARKFCISDYSCCPMCGSILRSRRVKGSMVPSFLGCSKYPKCMGTRSLTGELVMTRALKEWLLEKQKHEEYNTPKERWDTLEID